MPVSSSPPHTSAVQCMHTATPPHVLCLFVDWECIDLKLRKVLHKHMLAEGCISWMPAHVCIFSDVLRSTKRKKDHTQYPRRKISRQQRKKNAQDISIRSRRRLGFAGRVELAHEIFWLHVDERDVAGVVKLPKAKRIKRKHCSCGRVSCHSTGCDGEVPKSCSQIRESRRCEPGSELTAPNPHTKHQIRCLSKHNTKNRQMGNNSKQGGRTSKLEQSSTLLS